MTGDEPDDSARTRDEGHEQYGELSPSPPAPGRRRSHEPAFVGWHHSIQSDDPNPAYNAGSHVRERPLPNGGGGSPSRAGPPWRDRLRRAQDRRVTRGR